MARDIEERRADAQNLVARNRGVDEGVATDHPELGRHLSDEAQVEALAAHRPSGDLEEEVRGSVVRTFSFSMWKAAPVTLRPVKRSSLTPAS